MGVRFVPARRHHCNTPSSTGSCALCHLTGEGVMQHYVFVPSAIHAQSGDTVTVYNYDELIHRIVADDGSFDTGVMNAGASFTVKAGAAGTIISYHCTIHSRMKGSIIVDDPPLVLGITALAFSPSTVRI